MGTGCVAGAALTGGVGGLLHLIMVPAGGIRRDVIRRGLRSTIPGCPRWGKKADSGTQELKKTANPYTVVTLRDLAAPGLPAPTPPNCFFTQVQDGCKQHNPKTGKQEIGIWRTSRHRTFRTHS